ncbi:hypothetical protein TCAL_16982 [Tigriopus californicus]|uniref:Uncharacterized protein n=1 Tax=Tigriopus californicus TaxID=6832 RepID=A0A553PIF6_TIGCA|nr:hypothetical protein TCAL_16982 [Tigriopus californicus]
MSLLLSFSLTFLDIMVRNSSNSMDPFPSTSTSLIMSCNSASVGFWPKDLITVASSWREMKGKICFQCKLVHNVPSMK